MLAADGQLVLSSTKRLTLDSQDDITIFAEGAGALTLRGGRDMALSSKADLSTEEQGVSMAADLGLTAKSEATAGFTSGGQTTLRDPIN